MSLTQIFTYITVTVFSLFTLFIVFTAYLNTIPRKIGFRNIKRRLGNTILVVIGSMVGSALITGSLVLGDSLDKSFLGLVEKNLGEHDLNINIESKVQENSTIVTIDQSEADEISQQIQADAGDSVDGVLPLMQLIVSPQKIDDSGNAVINVFNTSVVGYDEDALNDFGETPEDIRLPKKANGTIVTEDLAKKLELSEGDTVRIAFGANEILFNVEAITLNKGLAGGNTMIVDNAFLSKNLGLEGNQYNQIFVSAKGGIEPKDYDGEAFGDEIRSATDKYSSEKVELSVFEIKEQALNGFGLKVFMNIFVVLSIFGVIAGVLLIINLYSMLAEERKYEMGILRAIALSRRQLTLTFIFEGYVYSLVSSFLGAIVGLGIGYLLATSFASMFADLLALADGEGLFEIVFDFKIESLVLGFLIGSLITIFTSTFASYRISKLNIVSAIRNIPEERILKRTWRWYLQTIVMVIVFFNGVTSTVFSTQIKSFFENSKEQGVEYFADLSTVEIRDMSDLVGSYLLYIGVVLTIYMGAGILVRIVKQFSTKDLTRPVITLIGIVTIVFTTFYSQIDSVSRALEQDNGIGLFFMSSLALVVSLSLVISYNVGLIAWVVDKVVSWSGRLRLVMRTSLRYQTVNQSRTTITLTMFAIIIFLIAFLSVEKALVKDVLDRTISESLGGYDLIIIPNTDVSLTQAEEMQGIVENVDGIKDAETFANTRIILPEYKYKDLPEKPFYGNTQLILGQEPEDFYRTRLNAIPSQYLLSEAPELRKRADVYKTDKEVWEALVNDPSKVVLGDSFVSPGFGKVPDLDIGDKVVIADAFNTTQVELEVIGTVIPTNSGPAVSIYDGLIYTYEANLNSLPREYVEKNSELQVMAHFEEGVDQGEVNNNVRKALIPYNLNGIFDVSDFLEGALSFINGLLVMSQGFLAFSLVVGTSGLAIIMTRAVQERRQQIGMMRSLGYQRSDILASFFIESTFITFLGIVIGVSMSLLSINSLVEVQKKVDPDFRLIINWNEIALICLLVYIGALLFSLLPSIKASRLSPVEATNYPE